MRAIGMFLGWALGFFLAMVGTLALNGLYRGVWMPLALIGLVSAAFAWHPRLSKSPSSPWFLAFFGIVAVAIFMRAVGPSPLSILQELARSLPLLLAVLSLPFLIVFLRRNQAPDSDQAFCLPAALLLAMLGWLIMFFSGSKGGPDSMVQLVMDLFSTNNETAQSIVVIVRKTIHFCFYGTLALSAYRLANPGFGLREAVVFGLAVALCVAVFDEFKQSMSLTRTGSLWDIGLDMLGAATFIGISVLRYRSRLQPTVVAERLP